MRSVNGNSVSTIVSYDKVFGIVNQSEIIETAGICGVGSFNVLNTVTANGPTIVKPPFGKVSAKITGSVVSV